MYTVIEKKFLSTVSILLDFKPCLDRTDKQRSAIWYTIMNYGENLVQDLLKRGSDIQTRDYKGFSPISLAISRKYVKITKKNNNSRHKSNFCYISGTTPVSNF
jgi:ankyrin repeat protein